jgi:hypothetical protein
MIKKDYYMAIKNNSKANQLKYIRNIAKNFWKEGEEFGGLEESVSDVENANSRLNMYTKRRSAHQQIALRGWINNDKYRQDRNGYADGLPKQGIAGFTKTGKGNESTAFTRKVGEDVGITLDETKIDTNVKYVICLLYISAHDESWGYKVDPIVISRL